MTDTEQTAELEQDAPPPATDAEEADSRDPSEIMAELLSKQDEDGEDEDEDAQAAPEGEESDAPADAESEEAAADAAKEGEETDDQAAEQPDEPIGEPPAHYTRAEKATLSKIKDPELREDIIAWRKEYERQAQTKFEEAAGIRKEFEPIDQALAPFREQMQASGMGRAETVSAIVGAWSSLTANPAQYLPTLVENFGRGIAGTDQARELVQQVSKALGVEMPASGGKTPANGSTEPWAAEVEAVKRELQGFKSAQQEAAERQRRAVVKAADDELRSFAEAKTDDGVQKHPHYDSVKSTMGALMQAAIREGSPIDLETAYQRAVRTRDDLPGAANGGLARKPAAATGKTEIARRRQAMTPKTRSVQSAPKDPESDDREPADIMRELLAGRGAGVAH